MARMFGFIGNRPDLGARVVAHHREVLAVARPPAQPLGWGVGFYQSGEVLLRRRPVDDRPVIDLVEVTANVRTDVLIGHVRHPSVGDLRTENTHPFRYRQWLFAQTGTIEGFDALKDRLLGSLPEFLKRSVRGDTDSELFFYLFLSFLHDAGQLGDPLASPDAVRAALRATIALVDRLSAEEGHGPNRGDLLVTNGEILIAVHRGATLSYRVWAGRHDIEELLGDQGVMDARIPNLDTARFCIVATGVDPLPARWTRAPNGSFLALSRTDEPAIEPL
jgi:predicted glutamine amidotransferase